MTLAMGDALDGEYEGTIPNPLMMADPTGTKKTVYYFIEVRDDDDEMGSCDHLVDEPAMGTHSVEVTKPADPRGTLMQCQGPCTQDIQCAADYECVAIPVAPRPLRKVPPDHGRGRRVVEPLPHGTRARARQEREADAGLDLGVAERGRLDGTRGVNVHPTA